MHESAFVCAEGLQKSARSMKMPGKHAGFPGERSQPYAERAKQDHDKQCPLVRRDEFCQDRKAKEWQLMGFFFVHTATSWISQIFWYRPPAFFSSSWVPRSVTRPFSIT